MEGRAQKCVDRQCELANTTKDPANPSEVGVLFHGQFSHVTDPETLQECVDTCWQSFTKWQDRRCQCAIYSTQTQNSIHPNIRTCSRPWDVLEDLLMFHVSVFFGNEVEMSFLRVLEISTNHVRDALKQHCLRGVNARSVEAVSHYLVFRRVFVAWRASLGARCLCFGHRLLRRCACRVSRLCYWHDVRPNLGKKRYATVVFRTLFFSVCQECDKFMSKIFHRVIRRTFPMRCSWPTQVLLLANPPTCSRPCPIFEALLEVHLSQFVSLEVVICFFCKIDTNHVSYVLRQHIFRKSKCQECWWQRCLIHRSRKSCCFWSPHHHFFFHVFFCVSSKSFHVVKKKKQDVLGSAFGWSATSQNLAGLRIPPTERQSSCTKFQVFAWLIIISRKRNLSQLENCQKLLTNCLEMLVLGTNC